MKWAKITLALILLFASATSGIAWARGGGHRGGHFGGGHFAGRPFHGHRGFHSFGFFVGPSLFWPSYYYWPYYPYYPYSPPIVVAPSSPPVYIEQGHGQFSPPQDTNYWYFCSDSQGYYPYVRECPAGWEKITPQPPNQESQYWYYCDNPPGYYPYVKECSVGWRKIVP